MNSDRSRFWIALSIGLALTIGSLVLAGCNRKPTSGTPTLSLAASDDDKDEAEEATEPSSVKDLPVDIEKEEELAPLCQRACKHWIDLRFPKPIGLEEVPQGGKERVAEILDRQRAVNGARCEEGCVKATDRDRAKCILRASTTDGIDACALR